MSSTSAQPRVADVVSWPVERVPLYQRIGSYLGLILNFAVVLVLQDSGMNDMGSWRLRDQRMPVPPETRGLGSIELEGTAPFMSRLRPKELVDLRTDGAWINPMGLDHSEVALPLPRFKLVKLIPLRPKRGRHYPSAQWRAKVLFDDNALELTGTWLELAWLAHLADWPLPADLAVA
ncbi:hypothetical protein ACFUC1_19655 [Pedococcus sp. NPDC057267]|uniref:hypothetical protein n=1 Tax=Pedococcus sp. NPDC057267 TaxID=3346077 RepID=UPI0036260AB7